MNKLTNRSTKMADELWAKGLRIGRNATKADESGNDDLADYLTSLAYGYRSMAADENVRMFGDRGKY